MIFGMIISEFLQALCLECCVQRVAGVPMYMPWNPLLIGEMADNTTLGAAQGTPNHRGRGKCSTASPRLIEEDGRCVLRLSAASRRLHLV